VLSLDLSAGKTKITFLKKDKAEFLGFQIWQTDNKMGVKKDLSPCGKLDPSKSDLKFRGGISTVPRIRITFSMREVLTSLVDKGLARFKNGLFFPTSYKSILCYDVANIIMYLKALFRGLTNYYCFCDNSYDASSLYNYYGKYCVAMTIAHKTKSTTSKIFKKFGDDLTFKSESGKVVASYEKLVIPSFKKQRFNRIDQIQGKDIKQLLSSNLRIAKMHMIH
jgi:hypothetical protein